MRRWFVLWLALAGCVPDLSRFSVGETDAGTDTAVDATFDASFDAADDADTFDASRDALVDTLEPFDARMDAGELPTGLDDVCETTWTELGASPARPCAGRSVTTIGVPFEIDEVAITRALDGTLVVAFDELDGPDYATLRTLSFDEASLGVTTGPTIEPEAAFGDVVGASLALVTELPDIHHLAYLLRSDFGHEIRYRTLRGGVFSEVQSIATGVGAYGDVDVALDSDNRAVVAWHDDASGANRVRRERADGSFEAAVTVRTDGDPRLDGPGRVALATGTERAMHVAFQWSVTLAASAPSYAVGTTSWSTPRTLDNQAIA
ncbi:MAG: hypothetical protein KC586_03710, partial [Myxococcales bacterium]|nr:hypothetical protein [Myxococcales bacterium]